MRHISIPPVPERLSPRTSLKPCWFYLFATLALIAVWSPSASATPITYTLTGAFKGTLGSTTLTGPVTFSQTSDTNFVQDKGGYTINDSGIVTFSANGLVATFLSPTFGVQAEYFSAAFQDTSEDGMFAANAFSYDIPSDVLSQVGVSYTGDYVSLLNGPVATSLGALTITGSETSTVFSTSSVAATPEPSSLALIGTGMLSAVAALKRRKIALTPR